MEYPSWLEAMDDGVNAAEHLVSAAPSWNIYLNVLHTSTFLYTRTAFSSPAVPFDTAK